MGFVFVQKSVYEECTRVVQSRLGMIGGESRGER
jgi:hypothetical protein